MKPKVLAAGNKKMATKLMKLIKKADAKTYQKKLVATHIIPNGNS